MSVNTMDYSAKPLMLDVIRTERGKFYRLIDEPKNWNVQTACEAWETRDIAGHMIDVTEGYLDRWQHAREGRPIDTHGLLVMAKNQGAYDSLTAQLAARTMRRVYLSVVHGRVSAAEGVIDKPIGRDPRDRTRMAVLPPGKGRRAVTHWRVLERFPQFTLVEARLETGRTHQIRVHFASLGHPVAGDSVYGGRRRSVPVALEGLALHAAALGFVNPVTQQRVEYSSPLPPRMDRLLSHLRHERSLEVGRSGHTTRPK